MWLRIKWLYLDNMIMKNKDEEDSNQGRFNEYKEGEDKESENESENDGENNPKGSY